MTSSVPPEIAWPIILGAFSIVVVRTIWFNDSRGEQRITAVLGLAALACVLRESSVQNALASLFPQQLPVEFTRQLSTTVIVLAMAPFFTVVLSWSLQEREPRWLAPSAYSLAAAFVPAMLILGSSARDAHQYIDRTPGWATVGYFSMFAIWVGGMAAVLVWACVSEIRKGDLAPRHIVSYAVVGCIGLWAAEEAASILASAIFASLGTNLGFVEGRFSLNEVNFVLMTAAGAVSSAFPAILSVAEYFGLDRPSRTAKSLDTLWRDLTDACPEVRYMTEAEFAALDSRRRLHRMTIEIRDSLLILRHFRQTTPPVDESTDPVLKEAVALHIAAASKRHGAAPGTNRGTAKHKQIDLRNETRSLEALAAQWEKARVAADKVTSPHDPAPANR